MLSHKQRHGNRQMIFLVELYQRDHPEEDGVIDPDAVTAWAIETGRYIPPPISQYKLLRRKISRALRNHYMEDPQGREVRKYHAVVEHDVDKTHTTVYSIENAPPEHMRQSCSLRRRSALRDVLQLKLDFDSYNENNKFGVELPPLDFDFNKDVEEMSLPTFYPLEAPEDELDINDDDDNE